MLMTTQVALSVKISSIYLVPWIQWLWKTNDRWKV